MQSVRIRSIARMRFCRKHPRVIVPCLSGLLAAAILAAPASAAAAPAEAAPTRTLVIAESAFDEQTIRAYVAIKRRVKQISDKWISRVMNAEGEGERQKIQARIQAEMEKTIRNGGLTVGEYHAITRAAQNDPQLRKMIDDLSAN